MSNSRIDRYFRWLAKKVRVDIHSRSDMSYLFMMRALFEKEFYWTLPFDEHRAMDGLSLRSDYFDCMDDTDTDVGPCTVLEVLVALAIICDRDLLGYGNEDRAYEWFWDMIQNLGLDAYTDTEFDPDAVNQILDRWLDRDYDQNGCGGLFYTNDPTQDMRTLEIWWQMQLYASEKFNSF